MNLIKMLLFKIRYYFLKRKLLKHIDSGKVIPVSNKNRGVGKTTALVEISKQFDIPIITYSKWHVNFLDHKGVKAYSAQSLNDLRGIEFNNGVLIDEGVSTKQIVDIKLLGIDIRTGFYYNARFI